MPVKPVRENVHCITQGPASFKAVNVALLSSDVLFVLFGLYILINKPKSYPSVTKKRSTFRS